MFPGRQHSVWLSWVKTASCRNFSGYFVNMEEPFRRTPVGFDTQDHTLDIEVSPELHWRWRDTEELNEHVKHGFYTANLAREVWKEGERAIAEIVRGSHPCLDRWRGWSPEPVWEIPQVPVEWSSVPPALWEKHHRAYGRLGELGRAGRSR
jgi:predicted RNA-binding protein associated with RNAse of E/G family